MEEKNKKCDGGGRCGSECCGDARSSGMRSAAGVCGGQGGCACGGMGMPHRFLIRVTVMLALLGFVFWSGIKIGELKSYFDGDGMMGGHGGYGRMYMMGGNGDAAVCDGYGPGMMRGRQATTTPKQ